MLTTVQGGTGAGRTMHRRHVPKTAWTCAGGHSNPSFATVCLSQGCREKQKH